MELKTKYLNMATKKLLVDQVVANAIEENDDGFKYVNYFAKMAALYYSLLEGYTDIDTDTKDLDDLIADGTVDDLLKSIPSSELNAILEAVKSKAQQEIDVHNSLSAVLSRKIDTVIEKMPSNRQITSWLNKLPKTLEKISPENMELIKSALNPTPPQQ